MGKQVDVETLASFSPLSGLKKENRHALASKTEVREAADGEWEVHAARAKSFPARPPEFVIPPEATADGSLTLKWEKAQGGGGPGRGLEVAEVWLLKK